MTTIINLPNNVKKEEIEEFLYIQTKIRDLIIILTKEENISVGSIMRAFASVLPNMFVLFSDNPYGSAKQFAKQLSRGVKRLLEHQQRQSASH